MNQQDGGERKSILLGEKPMKAIEMHAYGGPEVLVYEEVSRPKPESGEILIRVHAAGVNPVDWKIREGHFRKFIDYPLPVIPGQDFSGVVEELGSGVTLWKKGDEVFGRADMRREGSYAEYTVAQEALVARKPRSIDHIHAAAIPTAGLTAWQALFDVGALQLHQRALIHGAAGGVGNFAVQLAKWKGAHVVATTSSANLEFVRGLGADEVVDYKAGPFEQVVHEMNLVLDTIGGDTQQRSWWTLKRGGILVSIVGQPSQQEADRFGVRQAMVISQTNGAQLAELARLVDEGNLRVIVETVLPLSEARQAQEISQAGHARGKIVLRAA